MVYKFAKLCLFRLKFSMQGICPRMLLKNISGTFQVKTILRAK